MVVGGAIHVDPLVRADGYRSSVANSLAPLSWHITPIISCRRRLPAEQKRRYWWGRGNCIRPGMFTYIQHPRQSGPPGNRSEPWPSRWSPPALRTRSPAFRCREGRVKGHADHRSRGRDQRWLFVLCTCREKHKSSAVHWPELSILWDMSCGKGRHRLWSSNSLDRRDLNNSAHLDIRQYTRKWDVHSFDCIWQLHKLASSEKKKKNTQENID